MLKILGHFGTGTERRNTLNGWVIDSTKKCYDSKNGGEIKNFRDHQIKNFCKSSEPEIQPALLEAMILWPERLRENIIAGEIVYFCRITHIVLTETLQVGDREYNASISVDKGVYYLNPFGGISNSVHLTAAEVKNVRANIPFIKRRVA